MIIDTVKKLVVGRPLSTDRVAHERLSKRKALAVFSSDALSSVAYATEEILLALSLATISKNAFPWSWPIAIAISGLLLILVLSYRQVIKAYPNGGGAYTVCKENFGPNSGLVAAAALIIDYTLTVAVSIAAGTAAVTSAFPELLPHKVAISNAAILILMFINLRGIRESGTIFAIPTYIFIAGMLVLFAWLGYQVYFYPPTTEEMPLIPQSLEGVSWLILARGFSSGCAACTGVEAVSNGVQAFKHPEQENAKKTLVAMGGILAILFIGVTFFAHKYNILPMENETVVSQLARKTGSQWFYLLIQASTAGILFLAANTSFNGFPMVTSLLADDRYLPRQLASRGDRLVYSNGIMVLGWASIILIILFNSEVHSLIPMYAIGVFLCFSLTQAGMIKHWLHFKEKNWQLSVFINAVGLVTTTAVSLIIAITKFRDGGWIVILLIPIFVVQFRRIRYHYLIVGNQLRLIGPPPPTPKIDNHHVVIPVSGIHRGVLEALYYAKSISKDVTACYISITPRTTERIVSDWERYGLGVSLKILPSPFRSVTRPLLDFINEELKLQPHGMITVIIPEFVTAKWWQNLLHNQTAIIIRTALAFKRRVVVTSVRYHLTR